MTVIVTGVPAEVPPLLHVVVYVVVPPDIAFVSTTEFPAQIVADETVTVFVSGDGSVMLITVVVEQFGVQP